MTVAATIAATQAVTAHEHSRRSAPPPAVASVNACVPETGSRGWCGDGEAATSAKLAAPTDVAVAQDGSTYVADSANNVVRRIRRDGTIVSIAGTGETSDAARRDDARETGFRGPLGVAAAPDGSVLVADTGNDAVRRVSTDGVVRTVIGRGAPADVALDAPADVLSEQDGDVLVADTGRHRVLRVAADSSVSVVAGDGRAGFTGDGGPAADARLRRPAQVAVAPDGSVLIADSGNGAVRRVDAAGTIRTVTGGLRTVNGVTVTLGGDVVVSSDTALFRVGLDGRRQRIAGRGWRGFDPDAPALAVRLDEVGQLAVATDGALLFSEAGSDRVRRLTPDGHAETVAGSGLPVEPASEDVAVGSPPAGLVALATGSDDDARAALARVAATGDCRGYNARFAQFNIVPLSENPIAGVSRRRPSIRFRTSRRALVWLRVWRNGRLLREVGPRRMRPASRPRRIAASVPARRRAGRYRVAIWGRSTDGHVRCDARLVRAR